MSWWTILLIWLLGSFPLALLVGQILALGKNPPVPPARSIRQVMRRLAGRRETGRE